MRRDGTSITMPTTVISTTTTMRLANQAAPRVPIRARAQVIQMAPPANSSACQHVGRGARRSTARAIASSAMPRFSHVTIRMIRASRDSSSAGSCRTNAMGCAMKGSVSGPHGASRPGRAYWQPPGGEAHPARMTESAQPPDESTGRSPCDPGLARRAGVCAIPCSGPRPRRRSRSGAPAAAGRRAPGRPRAAPAGAPAVAPAARRVSRRTGCAARSTAAGPAARP